MIEMLNNVPDHVLLVIDEAYIEFLEDVVDLLPFIRRNLKPNLILMRTFSKIYGLAGLRVGYGIASPDLTSVLEKVRQPFNLNAIAQAAALAALDDTEHVERTRANNFAGLQYFESALRQLKLPFVPSVANFILVKVGNGAQVFQRMQERGVIVRQMDVYKLPEYIRISVGTPAENARCIETLKAVLAAPQ
jgi:histidinol-phosphate aminotransferase